MTAEQADNGDTRKERIARARRCIAYADRCVKEAKALRLPPERLEVILADADRLRDSAKAVVRALLDEKKGGTP